MFIVTTRDMSEPNFSRGEKNDSGISVLLCVCVCVCVCVSCFCREWYILVMQAIF